ncbi:Asp-tRNA(Asn)/Glu-tRNA(Gln) amidotransferase subunit GatB [Reichenbachiella versicolor]|uniref:Asp-tRNA(Asn)/Glu-tRNA(Gln) amidotransferase subunit GatB n=1 Tax=Reichenbachiella versicolor TaxID=1821036 RepID=UPI000D6DEF92|nr:Asp-tRNA(Asn)/Glu-tRNA(Gln) amidotransferase subunit GatB [Reichenbachiella versicolor]
MKEYLEKYDLTVGLEVHVQLATKSKLFAPDRNNFGDTANSNISPITLAHPGTLPKPNKMAIEYAIKMGLACQCDIAKKTSFDRKNYFYPDLPKGYQTTQDNFPIALGGYIKVKSGESMRAINLNRIHIEEDAGKSMHDTEHTGSMLDFNRAGTPLIEMVTEPEIHSAEEAGNFLTEVRKIVRYLEIGDGNMEEGSLRCDCNISLAPKGSNKLGKRVEIKNMNSIKNVQRAIEHEVKRQGTLLDNGRTILQETRGFNDNNGETTSQRSKEEANDYRYFPCPDLLPIEVTQEWFDKIKSEMPKLPSDMVKTFTEEYGLTAYDAEFLANSKDMADFFIAMTQKCNMYKRIANWTMGPIKNYLNENNISISDFPISLDRMVEIITLVDQNKLSFSTASTRVFPKMLKSEKSATDIATELELFQDDNEDELIKIIDEVIDSMPDKTKAYKNGKKGLKGLFMGQVMKKSGGKANPQIANKLLEEALSK